MSSNTKQQTVSIEKQPQDKVFTFSRRRWLALGGCIAGAAAGAFAMRKKEAVFVASNQAYGGELVKTIRDGLSAIGFDGTVLNGKRVLLKPNLVEPTREIPHMTTHPSMILAAAEVFRTYGASVAVGEAPGHVRDTEMALIESGVGEALHGDGLEFRDLNYEEVGWVENRGHASQLDGLFMPRSVIEADLIVTMPKLKTHHWVGMTASMKNLYGVLPGIKYGWPKNVLHYNGIPETVVDINSSLPPTLTIIDGIDCMEGDGPILGSMKHLGVVLVGASLPAVDATAARIMGLIPERISYLRIAGKLGPIGDYRIEQRGEPWRRLENPFKVLDRPHLRKLQNAAIGELVT